MKVTCRNQVEGCLAEHNDRDFDVSKAKHIDISRSIYNTYGNIYNDEKLKFKDLELKYYKENYGQKVKKTNEMNIKYGHKERCSTVEKYMNSHKPEETLLQVGTMNDNIDPEVFKECVMEYIKELEKYNSNCHILDWAIHVDEATPHAHIRKCWDYTNEKGDLAVSKEKALEKLGFKIADEHSPQSRKNNRAMVFDAMMREKWTQIVEERGFTIERKTEREVNPDRQDMNIHEYKEQKLKENLEIIREFQLKVQELETELSEQEAQMREMEKRAEEEREEQERANQERDAQDRALRQTIEQLNLIIESQKKQIKELEREIEKAKHKHKDKEEDMVLERK